MPRPSSPPPPDRTLRRPNGRWIIAAGAIAMVLGALIHTLATLTAAADVPSNSDAAALFDRERLQAVGRNLFWTGLPLLLTGMIVRALWFLAGDEEKPPP
jgi:hypothetical protein